MAGLGIAQRGHPVLGRKAQRFSLPKEAAEARQVLNLCSAMLGLVNDQHHFVKGCGIAAPQLGISRAAAIIRGPDGRTRYLLNPEILHEANGTDDQMEGCLSFFGVRGLVTRPRNAMVRYRNLDGTYGAEVLSDATARLACHEIDHLSGVLYTARLTPGAHLVDVADYDGGGREWSYDLE
jgi:peptide deformylase